MADINLNEPTSKNEAGVLAALWRKVLKDNNFVSAINLLVNKYVQSHDITEGRVANVKKMSKSTLNKLITSKEMTFKTLVFLIFNVLNAKRLDISIKVTFANGKTTTHGIGVPNPGSSDLLIDVFGVEEQMTNNMEGSTDERSETNTDSNKRDG